MSSDTQAWQQIDPATPGLPEPLEAALSGADPALGCLAVVVAADIDPRWGADVSLLLVQEWAAKGRKIFLADASFEKPVLHAAAGVANGEGVSDLMLYGASLRRVSQSVGKRVVLASTGTPVADVQELLSHPNWETVIRGFTETKATLVVHLPADAPGVPGFLEKAGALVVLASDEERVASVIGETSTRVLAVLGPAAPVADSDAVTEVEPDAEVEAPDDEIVDADVDSVTASVATDVADASPPEDPADAFSVTILSGSQYEAEAPVEEGVESDEGDPGVPEVETKADDEAPSTTDDDLPDDVHIGAGIDEDKEEIATAAATADRVDGFETGAGFEPQDVPGEDGESRPDEALAIESTAIEEGDTPTAEASAADVTGVAAPEYPSDLELDTSAMDSASGDPGSDTVTATLDESGTPALEVAPEEVAVEPDAPRRFSGLEELQRRRSRKATLRHIMIALVTIMVVGGGGYAVAYNGIVNIPGITPPERVRSLVPPPVELPGPVPETPVMSHVLFVDSWRDRATPITTAEALRGRLPQLLFFVTPIVSGGSRQYALFVGPAYGPVEANALKAPLAEVLDRLDPNDWLVQSTLYSFFFGEYGTVDEANARVEELAVSSVPTYVLEVSYAAAPIAFRVYGGAFSDEFQAAEMGRVMEENDVPAFPLTERRGRLPQ